MSQREHKTRRGALLAQLDHKRQGPGHYLVEGYNVTHRVQESTRRFAYRPSSIKGFRIDHWTVQRDGEVQKFRSFTEALEWIAAELEHRHG